MKRPQPNKWHKIKKIMCTASIMIKADDVYIIPDQYPVTRTCSCKIYSKIIILSNIIIKRKTSPKGINVTAVRVSGVRGHYEERKLWHGLFGNWNIAVSESSRFCSTSTSLACKEEFRERERERTKQRIKKRTNYEVKKQSNFSVLILSFCLSLSLQTFALSQILFQSSLWISNLIISYFGLGLLLGLIDFVATLCIVYGFCLRKSLVLEI